MKPFLKWAGGKSQLLKYIIPYIDKYLSPDCRFYEPFVGGGAVFLNIEHKNVHINDLNNELINCYEVVKNNPKELIAHLKLHKKRHCEDYYYDIRSLDRQEDKFNTLSSIEKAARIIYLNKTCYNGLYRVNSKGQFNTPIGKYKEPGIVDEDNILNVSKYMNSNDVKLSCNNYLNVLNNVSRGDFVYFDPPYHYEKKGFTGYTDKGFTTSDLIDLKNCADSLINKGCFVLISNNATRRVIEIFDESNYEIIKLNYKIERIPAKRSINSNGKGRQKVEEVLIFGRKNKEISSS